MDQEELKIKNRLSSKRRSRERDKPGKPKSAIDKKYSYDETHDFYGFYLAKDRSQKIKDVTADLNVSYKEFFTFLVSYFIANEEKQKKFLEIFRQRRVEEKSLSKARRRLRDRWNKIPKSDIEKLTEDDILALLEESSPLRDEKC